MSKHTLTRTTIIPSDLEAVFEFFENPHNLKEITPPWLNFRVVAASDGSMRKGTRIRYKIRWLGLSMPWESVIAEYESGMRFADEMLRGPYKSWYHVHEFRQLPNGVEMSDRVDYELPFGPLGNIAHLILVQRQLRAIFDYREKRINQIFGNSVTEP